MGFKETNISNVFNENNMRTSYGHFQMDYYALFEDCEERANISDVAEVKNEAYYNKKAIAIAKDINEIINGKTVVDRNFFVINPEKGYEDTVAYRDNGGRIEVNKKPSSPERAADCIFFAHKDLNFKDVAKKVLKVRNYLQRQTGNYVEIAFTYPLDERTHTITVTPSSTLGSLKRNINTLIEVYDEQKEKAKKEAKPSCQ